MLQFASIVLEDGMLDQQTDVAPAGVVEAPLDKDTANVQCTICSKNLAKRSSFIRHMRTTHKASVVGLLRQTVALKCFECNGKCNSFKEICQHYNNDHGISIVEETVEFSSPQDFELWKDEKEKATSSKFIKLSGKRVRGKFIHKILQCHRNGVYRPKRKNIRAPKKAGSNKLETFCPARMLVRTSRDEKYVTVSYFPKHVGHSCELDRLPLSMKDRNQLAAQMLQGVPKDCVLQHIAENFSSSGRLSLVRRKDLNNIARSFRIYSNKILDEKDAASVEVWVKESQSEDGHPVLLYKPRGIMSEEHANLDRNTFFLAYMNLAQLAMFQKFGEIVLMNSTRGTTKYNLDLTTLAVIDENCEIFPVAFLYCNCATEAVYTLFLAKIKGRLQPSIITPHTLMTDDASAFRNAWVLEFGTVKYNLLFDWYVQRMWREQLQTIPCCKKKKATMDKLKSLQHETNIRSFERLLAENVALFLNDTDTNEFGNFFKENYANRAQFWASCYKRDVKVNMCVSTEHWHEDLKAISGKRTGQLNKAIGIVMKCLQKKTIGRVVSKSRLKLSRKLREIQERHTCSEEADVNCVEKEEGVCWLVASQSTEESYEVTKIADTCNCNLVCDTCEMCLHQYMCSCSDSRVKYNMCKHIHSVCRVFSGVGFKIVEDYDSISDLIIDGVDTSENLNYTDVKAMTGELEKNDSEKDRDIIEAETHAQLTSLLEELENYTTEQLLECTDWIRKLRSKKKEVLTAWPFNTSVQTVMVLAQQKDHCYSKKESQ